MTCPMATKAYRLVAMRPPLTTAPDQLTSSNRHTRTCERCGGCGPTVLAIAVAGRVLLTRLRAYSKDRVIGAVAAQAPTRLTRADAAIPLGVTVRAAAVRRAAAAVLPGGAHLRFPHGVYAGRHD